jgi:predicted metal-dependent phosphoesterase TrpH
MNQVMEKANGAVGRAHLARVMVEQGYAATVKDAFNRFIAAGKVGYVPRQRLAVSEGCRLIAEHGGIPVIAHPGRIQMDPALLPGCFRRWSEKGLGGIEAFHPSHTDYQCIRFSRMAREMGMLITGGSDYHGQVKNIAPGAGMNRWLTMEKDVAELLRALRMWA